MTACSDQNTVTNKATVKADAILEDAKPSHLEQEFLNTFTDHAFIYKLKVQNKKIQDIAISMDEYNMGEYKQTMMQSSSHLEEQDYASPITLLFARQTFNDNQIVWTHSTITDEASSTCKGEILLNPKTSVAIGQIMTPLEIKKGEKIILGTLVETDKHPVSVYNNIEDAKDFKAATNYEHVYVLYLELK